MTCSIFLEEEIEQLREIKLWDVIVNASSVEPGEIQKNVFFWLDSDPCPQPKQLDSKEMPKCAYLRGYDSFQGSEMAYMYGIVFFVFFPVFCACAGYGLIKLTNSRRKSARRNQPDANCFGKGGTKAGEKPDHLRLREWTEPGKSRPVRINFGPGPIVTLNNR